MNLGRKRKNKKNKKNIKLELIITLIAIIIFSIASYFNIDLEKYINDLTNEYKISYSNSFDLTSIPDFTDEPYVVLNENNPDFTQEDLEKENKFEEYSQLDYLGRCGVAFAKIGIDTMPTEEREEISQVKPSGWQSVKYDNVDGKYLYNRCHLIGFQLAGENANEKNLITGTRYMNVQGMLPFENMIADFVKETKNHVLYRVTPIYEGENLVASGVQMEAKSVEDNGESICFNVYVYNAEPGITIDYSNGNSNLKN